MKAKQKTYTPKKSTAQTGKSRLSERFFTQILLCHIQAAVHVEGDSHRRLHVVGGVVEDGGVGNALFGAVDDEIILLAVKVVVAGDDVVFVVGRNAPVKAVGGLAVRVDVERCAGMLGRDALGVHVDALAVYQNDVGGVGVGEVMTGIGFFGNRNGRRITALLLGRLGGNLLDLGVLVGRLRDLLDLGVLVGGRLCCLSGLGGFFGGRCCRLGQHVVLRESRCHGGRLCLVAVVDLHANQPHGRSEEQAHQNQRDDRQRQRRPGLLFLYSSASVGVVVAIVFITVIFIIVVFKSVVFHCRILRYFLLTGVFPSVVTPLYHPHCDKIMTTVATVGSAALDSTM